MICKIKYRNKNGAVFPEMELIPETNKEQALFDFYDESAHTCFAMVIERGAFVVHFPIHPTGEQPKQKPLDKPKVA